MFRMLSNSSCLFTPYIVGVVNGSSIWSSLSSSHIAKIESVQIFFSNKIPGCSFLPYSNRLAKLTLNCLCHRRVITDLTILHSLVSGHSTASFFFHILHVPPSITRSHNLKHHSFTQAQFTLTKLCTTSRWRLE